MPQPWTEDQLARAWHDLMGSYHTVLCKLDVALKRDHDLSSSEFEVLQVLYSDRDSDAVRMNQLSEQVHLSQSALSRLVANLEGDGLVVRVMASGDRRSVVVSITEEGRQRYVDAKPTQRLVLREHASECLPPGAELAEPAGGAGSVCGAK